MLEFKKESSMNFNSSAWQMFVGFTNFIKYGSIILNSNGFQTILKSNATFDAIILVTFGTDALLPLSDYYKAPIIGLSTIGVNEIINYMLKSPCEYSYAANLFLESSDGLTFFQRTLNVLSGALFLIVRNGYVKPQQEAVMREHFPDAPPLDDLYRKVSLVLLNSHYSFENPRPYLPNMIPIGGFHIQEEVLPEDLKSFLDSAEYGAIYFSLGSNLKSSELPKDVLDAILNTFARFPKNKILWKFEDELIRVPNNLKIGKWLPQRAVLAHPNTRLFITHGGLLSTTEAMHFGIPIVGIPAFADQRTNVAKAVAKGFAVKLNVNDLNEKNFYSAISKVLTSPEYKLNAAKQSSLLRDVLVKPMDVAMYWIEHVIEHRGARHLQHAGLKLHWFQYVLLDVFVFLAAALLLFIFISYWILRKLFKLGTGQSATNIKYKQS